MLWSRDLSACRARFRADFMFATAGFPGFTFVQGFGRDPSGRSGARERRIIRGLPMIVNDLAASLCAAV